MRVNEISLIPATADTESGPELQIAFDECRLRYRDYRNVAHELIFTDVIQISHEPSSHPKYASLSDDRQYEVLDSAEVAALIQSGAIPTGMKCHHHLLGFNEHGGLFNNMITCEQHPKSAT